MPVAIIPEIANPKLISNYCIGCEEEVYSVCVFSDCPIEEVTTIYLDFHSRTSAKLTEFLLAKHWKIQPEIIRAKPGFIDQIKGKTAGLIIGDRAIERYDKFQFRYDLGEEWFQATGKPFVFATWVANKEIPESFIAEFEQAQALGLANMDAVIAQIQSPYANFSLTEYYKRYIQFDFTKEKQEALQYFLEQAFAFALPS